MYNIIKNMNYKEFIQWCNERACDGQWDLYTSITCINILEYINKQKVTIFKIKLKRKTDKLHEELWEGIKQDFKNEEGK